MNVFDELIHLNELFQSPFERIHSSQIGAFCVQLRMNNWSFVEKVINLF